MYTLFVLGWYSTGAYLWAKTLTDSLPLFAVIAVFYLNTSLYSSYKIYTVYVLTSILSVLCTQSIAQISAIIYHDETRLAFLSSIFVNTLFFILGNTLFPLKELHYSLQILSSLSYVRLSFESVLLIIYGFDRCSEDQLSTVLYGFQIETQDFWPNIIKLIIITLSFKFITFLVLISRINHSFEPKTEESDRIKQLDQFAHFRKYPV